MTVCFLFSDFAAGRYALSVHVTSREKHEIVIVLYITIALRLGKQQQQQQQR